MTARFTIDPPIASDNSWVGRYRKAVERANAAKRESQIEAIFHENMARRDQAAKDYGEPETPHEFYAGRPGSQAEKIVCDCLRELQAIPETDRLYAYELTDAISKAYLATAKESAVRMRRIAALLRIDIEATTHVL